MLGRTWETGIFLILCHAVTFQQPDHRTEFIGVLPPSHPLLILNGRGEEGRTWRAGLESWAEWPSPGLDYVGWGDAGKSQFSESRLVRRSHRQELRAEKEWHQRERKWRLGPGKMCRTGSSGEIYSNTFRTWWSQKGIHYAVQADLPVTVPFLGVFFFIF